MLYINDGKIRLIPWDNNLAYGGFVDEGEDFVEEDMSDEDWEDNENIYEEDYEKDYKAIANTYINFPIDTPFMTDMEKRQFFKSILENEECLERYHRYLKDIAENYIKGGKLQEYTNNVDAKIGDISGTEKTLLLLPIHIKKPLPSLSKCLTGKRMPLLDNSTENYRQQGQSNLKALKKL